MTLVKVPLAGLMLLIIAAIMIALLGPAWASVDLTFTHAEKHGEVTAATIRQICDSGGVLRTFQQDKERFIQICRIDERYGCRVVDLVGKTWYEVTAYVKDCFTGKSLKDIDDYARNKFWSNTNMRIK